MASLFQSFRSSTMPKRLLRYALSRLQLLDADALEMDNLDFALGRITVLEFRDVGIKLKKLEKLLQLPATFTLHKAKVLSLRVTVPMDFYTSPITVEVDGVDVRLKVDAGADRTKPAPSAFGPDFVPNTVDLAQSFLETEPSSERRRLEEALVAESQDLGASVSVSDDSGEDEPALGTGQPLSLPEFLADFLQGIVDRMQVRIKSVQLHLDMELPADAAQSAVEPVSFQIALQGIHIEGVTAAAPADEAQHRDPDSPPRIVPKEGKRHVSLANVRAYLISEANVFSSLTRSPSMTSAAAASPGMSRNLSSRQSTSLSQGSFHEQPMASLQESFREHLSDHGQSPEPERRLGEDSEEALGIPYDYHLSGDGDLEDESPQTPRASIFHEPHMLPGVEPLLSPTIDAIFPPEEPPPETSMSTSEASAPGLDRRDRSGETGRSAVEASVGSSGRNNSAEDLAESHIYTHEEAESMYMSAFSTAEPQSPVRASRLAPSPQLRRRAAQVSSISAAGSLRSPPPLMPGAWGDESESPYHPRSGPHGSEPASPGSGSSHTESGNSSPAFSRAAILSQHGGPAPAAEAVAGESLVDQDDVATPKGPTRVVKEIMHLETISVYIPSQHRHIHVQAASPELAPVQSQGLGTSIYPQAPGAFSVHGTAVPPPSSPPASPRKSIPADDDGALEIVLSPLSVKCDAPLGFLLARIVGKLLKAVQRGYPVAASAAASGQGQVKPRKTPDVRLTAEEISLNFLNRLSGVADTSERHLDPMAFVFDEEEVLLNATLQNLAVSICPTEVISTGSGCDKGGPAREDAVATKVDLQRLRFGYANSDIISFDSGRPVTSSVRDSFLSNGHDLCFKMVRSAASTTIDVETLPLVVQIDLQRLDETFGWFGGLSSFLNMTASTTTSSSGSTPPVVKSAAPPPMSRRPRGVHFETRVDHHHRPEAGRSTDAHKHKTNVRIAGALIELVGRDCSLAAETNAIKVVGRDEGVGAACSRIRISGPYLKNSSLAADPSIVAEVGGTRLELSPSPNDRDLEKLLELIIPSKVKFDDGSDDEIMVDTLLRQRRKGSVLRASVDVVNVRVRNPAQLSPALPNLGDEIAKLSTVARYLPEDDRPGLLTLAGLQKLSVSVDVGGKVGRIEAQVGNLEVGHITVPSLVALSVHGVCVRRNGTEDLVGSPLFDSPSNKPSPDKGCPVIMARMIGDEMEPRIKLKLRDLRIEYRVPTIMDVLGLEDDITTPQDFEASLAASVASLGDRAHATLLQPSGVGGQEKKPTVVDVGLRDCLVGLNPLNLASKMVVVLTDARLRTALSPENGTTTLTMNINKASILLADNVAEMETTASVGEGGPVSARRRCSSASAVSPQVANMCAKGFVDICYMSSAGIVATARPAVDGGDGKQVDVELRDDLLVLETCADSTQTLMSLVNALKPPTPPSKEDKYRTKVVPMEDLLASISAEAFGKPEGEYDFDQDFSVAQEMAGSRSETEYGGIHGRPLCVESQFYGDQQPGGEELFDATMQDPGSDSMTMQDTAEGVLLTGSSLPAPVDSSEMDSGDDLVIHDDFYSQEAGNSHVAKVWNSAKNTYDRAPDAVVRASPLKLSVRDVHIIWNLFDGYDWARTREVISKAVEGVEAKAMERQQLRQGGGGGGGGGGPAYEEELEDEETIGDFLFNSIYIGVPANRDPRELTRAINEGLNDDNMTETDSLATATTNRTARHHGRNPRCKHLRLNRSRHHKITFELRGVNVDMVVFPAPGGPGQETLSSVDVRVQALDIFDHVPTSTWKKFATYDQDQGEREMGTSMVHVELLTVKPMAELAASEIVVRATVLPLRLHVDQDALDFITRFFEFKDEEDDGRAATAGGDVPFVQRAEVKDIAVKLDFKPKRVDYAGLRSGHTTEFMNFVVLDEARMVLRHVIVYGVSGLDRLGRTLNDIWMPDVRRNQLPGVVAGLAPVRSLVNIGSGFRDLVEIPLREYRRDGRVMRGISRGAAAFARTTGTELVKLGAKLAVGTQYALQGAEEMLTDRPAQGREAGEGWDDGGEGSGEGSGEERKQISLYADQPTGVLQGIRGGYRSLTRDVSLARDAIIAVPGEVMESQTASGAARAVWRRAPTIIFRPAVGVTKAIGQTLMGATNTIDPENRRRIGEKYKH